MRAEGEDGINTVMEDWDEFDDIITQYSMRCTLEPDAMSQILYHDKIVELFSKRVDRKEFPTSAFLSYVQMSVSIRDPRLCEDLINYGFKQIYYKLAWPEKIYILDLATKFKAPQIKEYVELTKYSILAADYNTNLYEPRIGKDGIPKQLSM